MHYPHGSWDMQPIYDVGLLLHTRAVLAGLAPWWLQSSLSNGINTNDLE